MGNQTSTDAMIQAIAITGLVISIVVAVGLTLVTLITCCLLFRTKKDLRVLSEWCPSLSLSLSLSLPNITRAQIIFNCTDYCTHAPFFAGRKFDYAIATGKRGDEENTPQE